MISFLFKLFFFFEQINATHECEYNNYYTKTPMLLPEYYDQWADRMEDNLTGIDKDLCRSIDKGPYRVDVVQAVGTTAQSEYFGDGSIEERSK